MNVTYRNYRAADAEALSSVIDEAFSVGATVGSPRLRKPAVQVYLRSILAKSTWAHVAVVDGKAVGIICGHIPGRPYLPGHWSHHLATWGNIARIAITGIPHYKSLAKYPRLSGACTELRKQTTAPTTDELTLFAVASGVRGLGVGRGLYERFRDYLREHGRTDYFLYTDDKSSYGFYESRGMTRAASKDIKYHYNGDPLTLKTMLYTGSLDPQAPAMPQ